jgi:hypothetical protein
LARERLAARFAVANELAHAVNNPLQGSVFLVDLLRRQLQADSESKRLLNELEQQLERVTGLARGILEVTPDIDYERRH